MGRLAHGWARIGTESWAGDDPLTGGARRA